MDPWAGTLDVPELILVLRTLAQRRQRLSLHLQVGNVVNKFGGDALLIGGDDAALGVGEGDDGGAELDGFEGGVLGDVAGAGDGDSLAMEGLLA